MKWEELRRGDVVLTTDEQVPSNVRLVLTAVIDSDEDPETWVELEMLDLQTGRVKQYARVGDMPERYVVLLGPGT